MTRVCAQFPEPENDEDQSLEDWAYVAAIAPAASGDRASSMAATATHSESDDIGELEDMLYLGRRMSLGRELFTIHSNVGPTTQDALGSSTDNSVGGGIVYRTASGEPSTMLMLAGAVRGRSTSGGPAVPSSRTAAFVEDSQVDGDDEEDISRQIEAMTSRGSLRAAALMKPITARAIIASPQHLPNRRASSSANLRVQSTTSSGPEPGSSPMRLFPGGSSSSHRRNSQPAAGVEVPLGRWGSSGARLGAPAAAGPEVGDLPAVVNDYCDSVTRSRAAALATVGSIRGGVDSRSRAPSRSSAYALSDFSALMAPTEPSAAAYAEGAASAGQNVNAVGKPLAKKPGPGGSAMATAGSGLKGGVPPTTVTVSTLAGK